MDMDRKLIPWIAVALIVPAIVTLASSGDVFTMGLYGVMSFCCFPLAILGIYMWATGNGWRWTNGVDWTKMDDEQRRATASHIGKYIAVSMTIVTVSIPFMLSNFIVGILMIAAGCILALVPFINLGNRKLKAPVWDGRKTALGVAAVSIVCLAVPFIPVGNTDSVNVTFDEESFRVSAPMFDHEFRYDEIEQHELDPDFEKGSRKWGYGTPDIMSGKFRNSQFGDYELASYAKVGPCIVISVGGDIYAFNQSSDAATQACYDELLSRLP